MKNYPPKSAKNENVATINQHGKIITMAIRSCLSGNKQVFSAAQTMIAAFALFAALGATAQPAGGELAPDPTNMTFTLGYGETNSIAGTQTYVLQVPTNVSATAYLLGTTQSWLSVADSEGAVSGTIAPGTNKTIFVTILPAGLALGSYTGKITSGAAWLDVTVNLDIVPMELGLDGLIVNNKKYDGNVTASVFSYGTLRGVVGTEDVTLVTNNVTAVFRHGAKPSSEPNLVYVSGLTLAGAHAGNYSINNIRSMAYIMTPSVANDFDGDRLADMAMMATSGVWKIWMSSANYAPVRTCPFYVEGCAVLAGDFDGDGKADPTTADTNGIWKIWLSSASYIPVIIAPFYVEGSVPVTGDFDGDRFADPAAVAANGVWMIWMSSANYAPVNTSPFNVAGGVPVAGDFDGDGKADPAMMATNGVWKIWMSSARYAPVNTSPFYVEGAVAPVADDLDGDGLADPAVVAVNGAWKVWLSRASYAPVITAPLIP